MEGGSGGGIARVGEIMIQIGSALVGGMGVVQSCLDAEVGNGMGGYMMSGTMGMRSGDKRAMTGTTIVIAQGAEIRTEGGGTEIETDLPTTNAN